MRVADLLVILVYFAVIPWAVLRLSGKGQSAGGFLSAHHDLPWWAICLSLVATETSTLTFISVPGVGYTGGMVFTGLAGGYLIGRIIVAVWFLPLYASGAMTSAYQYLGQRFGKRLQQAASFSFLLTRLMAEGVRLLAGLLPVMWLLGQTGLPVGRFPVLVIIMAFTLLYTLLGGLRAVVWSDTIQLVIYLSGAAVCAVLLATQMTGANWHDVMDEGWLRPFHTLTLANALSDPFTPLAALLGGGIMAVASHGTDQLMVQRLLAARTLRDARLALIGSAFLVGLLFTLLSLTGVELRALSGNASLAGVRSSDEIFPRFIVSGLPEGLSGLLVAGVLSATMGSLSSTLSAMAGATLTDFGSGPAAMLSAGLRRIGLRPGPLLVPRLVTLFWALALVGTAMVSGAGAQAAIILGLTITGWSWGPVLGTFLAGMIWPEADSRDALTGFVISLAGMGVFMIALQVFGWHIAFPWLVPLGVVMMLLPARVSMRVRGFQRKARARAGTVL